MADRRPCFRPRPPCRRAAWFPGAGLRFLATAAFTALLLALPERAVADAVEGVPRDSAAASGDLTDLSLGQLMDVEVVRVASRYEQALSEAPASVTVITAAEIGRRGCRTLAELLESVPGFFTSYDRDYNYSSVRGFGRLGDYNLRMLLLVDGQRINDDIYDYLGIGSDFILDLDMVERVEVIRGPGSSLYGTNALVAVVDVITRGPATGAAAWVSGSGGSFGTAEAGAGLSRRTAAGLEVTARVSLMHSDGQDLFFSEFNDPSTRDGWSHGADGTGRRRGFLKLRYRGLTLEAADVRRDKHLPTAVFDGVFGDPRSRAEDEHGFVAASYEAPAGREGSLQARLGYSLTDYTGVTVTDVGAPGAPDPVEYRDVAVGRSLDGGLQWTGSPASGHKMVLGVAGRWSPRQELHAFDPVTSYLDDTTSSGMWAAYAQDEVAAFRRLRVSTGLRFDHYSSFGGTLSPRVALVFSPAPGNAAKLVYGSAFRAPNDYELRFHELRMKSGPALEPEELRTLELVLERELRPGLRAAVSGFWCEFSKLISLVADPADSMLTFSNLKGDRTAGVEAEMSGSLGAGVHGSASYTYQRSRDELTGGEIPNCPRHLAKLDLTVPLAGEQLSVSPWVRLMSRANYADAVSEDYRQLTIPQDGRAWSLALRARL